MVVSANDVKKNGVSIFDELFKKFDEVIINFRGKNKYVVIEYERYKAFREYELDKAYNEVMQDIESGEYRVVSAKEHIERLNKELENV